MTNFASANSVDVKGCIRLFDNDVLSRHPQSFSRILPNRRGSLVIYSKGHCHGSLVVCRVCRATKRKSKLRGTFIVVDTPCEIVRDLRTKMSFIMINSQTELQVLKMQNQELHTHRGRNRGKQKTKNGYAVSCLPV